MEHGRFDYLPITGRPPLRLPNNARVAVWVVPNVEYYPFGKPAIAMTQMTASLNPDVLNAAWRDYGARVGIWRLMEIFDRQGIPVTAALNSDVCAKYPQIVEAGSRLGWEWMAHGPNNAMLFTGMDEATEHGIITTTINMIASMTGVRPRGWLGPALTETSATLDVLSDAGIDYVADWCNDELPYEMTTRSGSMLAVPYTLEIGDIPHFLFHGGSGPDFERMIVDQFNVLYHEGSQIPRIMSIALHPFIVGHPFRAYYLERALAHIRGHLDVWMTTGSAITDWYRGEMSSR
jgi:allantoinase